MKADTGRSDAVTRTDELARTGDAIYNMARESALKEIESLKQEVAAGREDGERIGFLRRGHLDRKWNEMVDAVMLYKTKESKEYRKEGFTWEGFCEAAGYNVQTANSIIHDIRPLVEEFSVKFTDFAKVGLSKIRYLGRSISGNFTDFDGQNIIVGDEKIPFTPENVEEINAAIEALKEAHKAQQEELAAQKKAFERVQSDTHKTITKLERELAKHEKTAASKGLTPDEDAFLRRMEFLRAGFDGYMLQVDPERMEALTGEGDEETEIAPTPRMVAAYLSTLDYMRKQVLAAFDTATTNYGDPVISPEEAWRPGMGAALEAEGKE